MNPAEEIVKHWLQTQGYFLQTSIRLPKNREIDILADNRQGDRIHVEVQVSVRSANYQEDAQSLARDIYDRKFKAVEDEVAQRLGKPYRKRYVVGRIAYKNQDIRDQFIIECKKLGVDEVVKFEEVLETVGKGLATHTCHNPVIWTVQLCTEFLKR